MGPGKNSTDYIAGSYYYNYAQFFFTQYTLGSIKLVHNGLNQLRRLIHFNTVGTGNDSVSADMFDSTKQSLFYSRFC